MDRTLELFFRYGTVKELKKSEALEPDTRIFGCKPLCMPGSENLYFIVKNKCRSAIGSQLRFTNADCKLRTITLYLNVRSIKLAEHSAR